MRSVLIIEDNCDLRELCAEVAHEQGVPTLLAADGQEAIECLNRAKNLPGVILLDLMMPGMDGWTFLDVRNRERPVWFGVPIVICSATDDRAPAGFATIPKPIGLEQLVRLLDEYCVLPDETDANLAKL